METVDVVVIGGGPAGSTTAALLARAGVRVTVLERETFPRFHIGESLLPQSMKVFATLGVLEQLEARFLRKHGARFIDCPTGRMQEYLFAEAFDRSVTHAFEVPRAELDALLLDNAAALGADVRHRWEVTALRREGEAVVGVEARDAEGNARSLAARVVVDATGRDALSAGRQREKQRLPGLDNTALYQHFDGVRRRSGDGEGNIDIAVFPHGWFWNIPFRGGVNSVGVVCRASWIRTRAAGESLSAFFDRTVATAPFMQELLAQATRRTPTAATADFSYRVDRLCEDGLLRVGDSGGFIDPLFSTGVHLAFHGGALAAETIATALAEGDVSARRFADYERVMRRGAELFLGAVQSFYQPDGLADLVFQEPQRKVLRQTITSLLAGDVFDERAVWSRFLRERYRARLPGSGSPAASDSSA